MASEELDEVNDLLIDDRKHKVRVLEVSSSSFPGRDTENFLMPIDAI
jgi:PRC-barrel domain